jgi:transcriptional regulator with XRE-family HTH domain
MSQIEENYNLGEIFKQRRLEKKLSLEEVSNKTKIPLRFLSAIENNETLKMHPVYIKGLLKIYCNFLGLDYYQILKMTPFKEKEKIKKESVVFSRIETKNKKTFLKWIIIFIAGVFILSLFLFILKYKIKKPSSVVEKSKRETEAVEFLKWPKQKSEQEPIKVKLQAIRDCWLKANVDGKVVFQGILKKGRFQSWQANNYIELSLGNIEAIQLYLNDKLFSPLGRKGQIIRKILINQEGLQVLK